MSTAFSVRQSPLIQTMPIGDHHALIIDNFLDDPDAMVSVAASSLFTPYPRYEERKGYPGVRAIAPADYSYNITLFLDGLIKHHFGVPAELPIRKSVCAFSLTSLQPEELGPLQRTPHFDASTPNHMAVLLYLCDERHGGTAFYRHNATGLQQITESTREHYLDVYYEEINARRPPRQYFDDSDEQFTRIGKIPARYNRLVIYRGSLLHSAIVNPAISIATHPREGRLTVNTFYDF
ncbi:DUF6445 family protein [Chitinimonas sp. BJYL2]|uniref:DUF6445 family protein n=1 Tax=Chitinimonas sp. BJYL2 TaxID=2976696 RepID=UPI0022B5948D|nr:DUF6445 family protein [Chitinimonas sp. BJYL2]